MMYRKSCLAHPVSHHLYARPWEATGHRRPREATGGHGRPREAMGGHGPHPTVPPKILYLLKWAGRGRQKGRLRRKPATGGNGGQRGATARQEKSPATPTAPLQYLRGPLQAAPVWGTYSEKKINTKKNKKKTKKNIGQLLAPQQELFIII